MRKYFFSAMALVLGLFTVTAVFAFGITEQTETSRQGYHYYKPNIPEAGWQNHNNWVTEPGGGSGCDAADERICRIPIVPETVDLDAFLLGLTDYGELTQFPGLEWRSEP